jgi:hypothetical protein
MDDAREGGLTCCRPGRLRQEYRGKGGGACSRRLVRELGKEERSDEGHGRKRRAKSNFGARHGQVVV